MAVMVNGKFAPIEFEGSGVERGRGYNDKDPKITSTNRAITGAVTP
jgi:hypothetical protein